MLGQTHFASVQNTAARALRYEQKRVLFDLFTLRDQAPGRCLHFWADTIQAQSA